MNNHILTSSIISVVYFICKFIQMRFLLKENKPLKKLVTDTLIVFISATMTILLLDKFNINEMLGNVKAIPKAFVNKPDF